MQILEYRSNPKQQRNLIIEQAAFQIDGAARQLARLGVEMRTRATLDDADVAAIDKTISGAKAALAKVEVELASPASKARETSPEIDGQFVAGGVLS